MNQKKDQKKKTHLSLNEQTSSINNARSALVACVTHFSTTFDANLCCDKTKTFPRTLAISADLSSGFPCSGIKFPVTKKKNENKN